MRRILAAMTGEGPDATTARATMVERQLRGRGISDARVLDAMGTVPRERFVPDRWRGAAYADEALPIDAGQTISQPAMVGQMTELLRVRPGARILEIGTGSGYQAAVLATMGAEVTSIERQASLVEPARRRLAELGLAERVRIRAGDGSVGDPAGAPWDGIIVTAAAPEVPQALREQLADGARLVIPVGPRWEQLLTTVERHGDDWTEWSSGGCVFVPLIGEAGFDPEP